VKRLAEAVVEAVAAADEAEEAGVAVAPEVAAAEVHDRQQPVQVHP